MDTNKIAAKIKALRKEKGWTQSELAEKLNVSSQLISKWETGEGVPSFEFMIELSKALGVHLNYFVEEDAESEDTASADAATSVSETPTVKPPRKPLIKNKKAFWISFGSACAAVFIVAITLLSYYVFAPAANKQKYDAAIDAACSAYFAENGYYNIKVTRKVDGEEKTPLIYQGYFDENGKLVSYNSEKGTKIGDDLYFLRIDSVDEFTMPNGIETIEDWAEYDMFGDDKDVDEDDPYGLNSIKYIRKQIGGYYFEFNEEYLTKDMAASVKKNIEVKKLCGYAEIKRKAIEKLSFTVEYRNKKDNEDFLLETTVEFLREFPQIEIPAVNKADFAPLVTEQEFAKLLFGKNPVKLDTKRKIDELQRLKYDSGKYLYDVQPYTYDIVYLTNANTLTYEKEVKLENNAHDVHVFEDRIIWGKDNTYYYTDVSDPTHHNILFETYSDTAVEINGRYAVVSYAPDEAHVCVYDLQECRKIAEYKDAIVKVSAVDTAGYAYVKVGENAALECYDWNWEKKGDAKGEVKSVDGDSVYTRVGSTVYRYKAGNLVETLTSRDLRFNDNYQYLEEGYYFKKDTCQLVDASGKAVKIPTEYWEPVSSGKYFLSKDEKPYLCVINGKILLYYSYGYSACRAIIDFNGKAQVWARYNGDYDDVERMKLVTCGQYTYLFYGDLYGMEVWVI